MMTQEEISAIRKDYDQRIAEGRELDGLVPVKLKKRVAQPRGVFTVRLSSEEVLAVTNAAAALNLTTSEFVRMAAMAAAQGTKEAKRMVALEKARGLVQEAAEVLSSV